MLERLQQNAREAIIRAKDEANRAGQRAVSSEHLLLGLLSRPGHAADALKAAGADEDKLRASIAPDAAEGDAAAAGAGPEADATLTIGAADGAAQAEPGAPDAEDIPLTSDAKRALELAQRAAKHLKHRHITAEHLLLGVIDQQDGPAVQALTVAGLHVGTLRTDVLRRISSGADRFES